MAIVKACVRGRAVGEVARTVMLGWRRASRSIAPATVTTPRGRVDGEPAAGVVGQAVGHGVGGGVGVDGEGGDPDRGADGRRSRRPRWPRRCCRSASNRELVDVVDRDREGLCRRCEPSAEVARTVMLRLAPRLAVDRAGHGHHAAWASMANRPPALSAQRIGHGVGGGVGVAGERGDPDHGADGRVLVDRVGRGVVVGRGRDRELVDVVDRDREGLVAVEPSALVARTVMLGWRRRLPVDRRRPTVTTPVPASMANRPAGVVVSE